MQKRHLIVLVTGDIFLFIVTNVAISFILYSRVASINSEFQKHFALNLLLIPLYLLNHLFTKKFNYSLNLNLEIELKLLFKSLIQTFLLIFLVLFIIVKPIMYSRYFLFCWFFSLLIVLPLFRYIMFSVQNSFWKKGKYQKQILVFGNNPRLKQFFDLLRLQHFYAYNIKRIISKDVFLNIKTNTVQTDAIIESIQKNKPDIVFFNIQGSSKLPDEILEYLSENNIDFQIISPDLFYTQNYQLVEHKGFISFKFKKSPAQRALENLLKRIFDIIGGIILLIVSLPIWIFYSIYLYIYSPGPILHRTERLGKHGITFIKLKFRTMVINAEEELNTILNNNVEFKEEYNSKYKLRDDPRLIKYADFFRKRSIDEIPQLLNIINGDMSLVGPRDIIKPELEKYGEFKNKLLSIKPGLTGLWQVNGRSLLSYEDRVLLDMYYIDNWSIWLDFSILLRTFKVVLTGYGAV